MDTERARARLADDRRRTAQRLSRLQGDHAAFVAASRDTNADDEHDPEGATIAFERSQVGALTQQALDHLAALDAAEARLGEGTYGRCTNCGSEVPSERLEVRPTAATCVGCA